MMFRALLCLALFVGSVSAWGSWFSMNKNTECGSFRSQRAGWLFSNSMTDIDTRQFLDDMKAYDTNKDGYVTPVEMRNPTVAATFDSAFNLTAGVDRCTFVTFFKKRYGISTAVAGRLFDIEDVNGDLRFSTADRGDFSPIDEDGDGRVPVCVAFRGGMAILADLENKVYLADLKYTNIVYKYRKPSPIWSWGWSS
ncbi:uncharacterized protein LOC124149058 [Haliotis rufescens]|uniref:uncharacterized protein LOC124149058 n=1 Tax=Haliotis rufescens TaxID=6454 RepID=UPI00201EE02F|nr:uncharacterized protein LOC124149058 [Haliotis rufescens]XP_046376363.2 uncharacterized protein LOC124149058 [Haliotis rufescens]